MDEVGVVGQRLEHEKREGYLSDSRLEELIILTFGHSYMFHIELT